ncbi:6-carboxytetrahydropterin synthase [Puteibacter caeruleilacunae]|nr:6-carboxytetrahydropterin synthase [Puteibacter caeruleilacunae]
MIIRKLFKFEGAHVVRNCSSQRCKENVHGHSYKVEVFISSNKVDKGYMVLDFKLLDKVKLLIDSFDHSFSLWNREDKEFKEFVYKYNSRVAEIPVSPSAEGYALMFFKVIDEILKNTVTSNGEGEIRLSSVRVHETETGYAEAFREDEQMINFELNDVLFSTGIQQEWKNGDWWKDLLAGKKFINPVVDHEID